MKIKHLILCLIICIITEIAVVLAYMPDADSTKVDMLDINERYIQAVDELEQGAYTSYEIAQVEEKYSCSIYLKNDIDYDTNIYNAIRNRCVLLDMENVQVGEGKIAFSGQTEKIDQWKETVLRGIVMTAVLVFLTVCCFLLILYFQYISPFKKLEKFAGYISKGNFEFPLPIKKRNYFGAFTESFDIMREEMKRARQSEYEANISKKELVASLSHDIKTPVATIKAICELLEIKLTGSFEKEKIHIILQKADMIDHLISDMFNSTLQDLEKLKINVSEEMSSVLEPMFLEINYYDRIHIKNSIPECLILVDALRLNQVIDNIINNSYKYAASEIDVYFEREERELKIAIKDYGQGIDDEELPLVMEKFYRGKNADKKAGSGLGLYLSKTFIEGMGGSMTVENNNGLLVTLRLPLV